MSKDVRVTKDLIFRTSSSHNDATASKSSPSTTKKLSDYSGGILDATKAHSEATPDGKSETCPLRILSFDKSCAKSSGSCGS